MPLAQSRASCTALQGHEIKGQVKQEASWGWGWGSLYLKMYPSLDDFKADVCVEPKCMSFPLLIGHSQGGQTDDEGGA